MAEYTTVAEMQLRLGPEAESGRLQDVIAAAARTIEDATDRRFDLDVAATARQYRVVGNTTTDPDGQLLLIDDIGNLTDLVVETGDGTDWTMVTDFATEPLNALAKDRPVTKLRRNQGIWTGNVQTRVTARWGWPSVPDTVADANRILAERLYRRPEAPWGAAWNVSGVGDIAIARLASTDPDVAAMIEPYILVGA